MKRYEAALLIVAAALVTLGALFIFWPAGLIVGGVALVGLVYA